MRTAEIGHLLKLELLLDMRQKHALGGSLLYVVSAVYICQLAMRRIIDVPVWNALFWIILLFVAFNALSRSFQREDAGRQLYVHTLVSPRNVVLARMLYNVAVMLLLGLTCLIFYVVLIGDGALQQARMDLFVLAIVLGAAGFASVLTLISAIAARAGSGIGLMAILGFPLVIPMLLSVMRASKLALDGIGFEASGRYFLGLLAIDLLTAALAWILFPYLWRD